MQRSVDIERFSAAVSTIYDAAIDPGLWPAAIERVAQMIDGVSGVIMMLDTVERRARLSVSWNVGAEDMRVYNERYHADNPLNAAFPSFDIDEPYNVSMVMEPSRWVETKVYREFGHPRGWLDNVGVTVLKTPPRFASLAIPRKREAGYAGPRELEIMRLVSPHVRRAVTIADLIELRELTANTFEATFDSLRVPVLFVDKACRILHANRAARELFAAGGPVTSERGVLKAWTAEVTHNLERAVAAGAAGGEHARTVFTPCADGRVAFAYLLPLQSGPVRGRIEPSASVAVFITPGADANALPADVWGSAFGVTAAELRVLKLLVDGISVKDVAARLALAPTTVRTHVAKLMQKTGAKRQSDLIRLAMRLMPPVRAPSA